MGLYNPQFSYQLLWRFILTLQVFRYVLRALTIRSGDETDAEQLRLT